MGEKRKEPMIVVRPANRVVDDRNMELAKAIWEKSLQMEKTNDDYRIMTLWATEMAANCSMMISLDKMADGMK